ncbi:MAG TPA: response regulator transcription factor [Clostridiales bacterium]|nr:response regulator transcription factor [Clostridiales bacterium]
MRVAICDDEIIALDSLRMLLKHHAKIQTLRSFLSPELLLEAVDQGEYFDVVFMDIEWKQSLNGIDFASELNNASPCTQIIYVTGYNDRFSQRIFLKPSNLCGYLLKPIDSVLLDNMLQKAWDTFQKLETQKLIIQHNSAVHAIPFHTICYMESQGHQLIIHTLQDRIICYERLELLKQRLPKQFLHCHKSYLVNMDHIRRIENRQIILKRGEELPVSKAKYAETRSAYFRYMGEIL